MPAAAPSPGSDPNAQHLGVPGSDPVTQDLLVLGSDPNGAAPPLGSDPVGAALPLGSDPVARAAVSSRRQLRKLQARAPTTPGNAVEARGRAGRETASRRSR